MTNNLLIVMSDEHQARAMGCAGHAIAKTPNLDALAAKGVRFSNAYTPSPICVPARAAFATGRYVHDIRLWDNAMPYDGSLPGWGHALQAGGVAVESIGKLHYRSEEDPAGFDAEHLPMMVVGGHGMVWASIRKEDERVSASGRMLGDYIGPGESTYTKYDTAVTERAVQWFKDRAASGASGPWCLYVGLVAPHFPLICPEEFYRHYPLDDLPEPKLHPDAGHTRHPWVELQNAMMDSEAKFESRGERQRAVAAYFGLTTWMDHNVGLILKGLDDAGYAEDTTVIYTSDHGDNVGARGLWGKSNHYEESVAVPLIMASPGAPSGVCDTAVSLIDLSAEIPAHFGLPFDGAGVPLSQIAARPEERDRLVFSEYHAAGAVSGAYMLRRGHWKLIHYVGFEPELFNLKTDPEETTNMAGGEPEILLDMMEALMRVCNPDETDALAFADQAEMIARYGGRETALTMGAPGATPPPDITR